MFGGGRQIAYCKHCLMPNTRPRIQFDEHGVCNACLHAQDTERIDWDARSLRLTLPGTSITTLRWRPLGPAGGPEAPL